IAKFALAQDCPLDMMPLISEGSFDCTCPLRQHINFALPNRDDGGPTHFGRCQTVSNYHQPIGYQDYTEQFFDAADVYADGLSYGYTGEYITVWRDKQQNDVYLTTGHLSDYNARAMTNNYVQLSTIEDNTTMTAIRVVNMNSTAAYLAQRRESPAANDYVDLTFAEPSYLGMMANIISATDSEGFKTADYDSRVSIISNFGIYTDNTNTSDGAMTYYLLRDNSIAAGTLLNDRVIFKGTTGAGATPTESESNHSLGDLLNLGNFSNYVLKLNHLSAVPDYTGNTTFKAFDALKIYQDITHENQIDVDVDDDGGLNVDLVNPIRLNRYRQQIMIGSNYDDNHLSGSSPSVKANGFNGYITDVFFLHNSNDNDLYTFQNYLIKKSMLY
ncbi:MAG: hypothetical protein AAF153_01910, partial [Pseudomonadota bacterium]